MKITRHRTNMQKNAKKNTYTKTNKHMKGNKVIMMKRILWNETADALTKQATKRCVNPHSQISLTTETSPFMQALNGHYIRKFTSTRVTG